MSEETSRKTYTNAQFSDAALAVLQAAEAECKASRADKISSEHLLLALIADTSDRAGEALRKSGLKADQVRKKAQEFADEATKKSGLNQMHTHSHNHDHQHDNEHTPDHADELTFAALGKWILTGAIDLAKEQKVEKATPEHILIAMIEEGTGVANRLLNHFKIDQDKLTASLNR